GSRPDSNSRPPAPPTTKKDPPQKNSFSANRPTGSPGGGAPPAPPGATARLSLAPFSAPVDEGLRRFLGSTPLAVPKRDEERFLRDFYPRLQRRIAVHSVDESVSLPEL